MIATALCNTYMELGMNAHEQGFADVADQMLSAAFEEAQRLGTKEAPPCNVFNRLAHFYYQRKEFDRAELVYEQAFVLYERMFSDGDPNFTALMLNLAELYFSRGKYASALPLYERALSGNLKGNEKCLLKLAWIYCNEQRFTDAERIYSQAKASTKTASISTEK